MKHKIFSGIVLLALLLMVSTAIAQEEEEATRTGFRPDAPTYGVRGPHPVGTMDMVINDEDRPLPVTIWYPALNVDGLEEAYTYPLVYPPAFPPLEAYGMALFEADPDIESGPYPLVVWSHGFAYIRAGSTFFGEHLASWGFVVIAPDHLGMTASELGSDPSTFYPMYYNSPRDVSLVIDFAETINADGVMVGMVDTEHIAATGHSSGGFTALQAGGAQLDLAGLLEFCEDVDGASFDCPYVTSNAEKLAALYGLSGVPDDLLPPLGDDRIDALIPLAPDQVFFGENGLNNVTLPTLYMAGVSDMSVPIEDVRAGFASLGSETAYRVEFDYGGHGLFQDACERFPALIALGFYDLCGEKVWDKLRAQDIINHYATSFLLWQFKNDETAAAVFGDSPETFTGVEVIVK